MSLLKGSDTLREMYPKVNSKFADLDAKDQELKDELDAYKLEHEQQRQSDQLKVAKVEKELNDYKATMQQVNIHQNPTQKASGHGIVSLPPNAAEGQISVVVKGNTRTNLLKNSSLAIDSDGNGRADDWSFSQNLTCSYSIDGGQKFTITNSTASGQVAYVHQIIPVREGQLLSFAFEYKTANLVNLGVRCELSLRDANNNQVRLAVYQVLEPSSIYQTYKKEGLVVPSGLGIKYARLYFIVYSTDAGASGEAWIRNAIMEEAPTIGNYISSGTKSTLCGAVKSVGKNQINFLQDDVYKTIQMDFIAEKNKITIFDNHTNYNRYVAIKKKVKRNTDYYLSGELNGTIFETQIWNQNFNPGQFLSSNTINKIAPFGSSVNGCFNSGDNNYIWIIYYPYMVGTHIIDNVMLEYGTNKTEYEPYTESTQYITAKDEEGNILELRSLPNGTKDEFNVVEGKYTKKVSDPVSVSGTMFASLDTTTYVNVDVVKTTAFSLAQAGTTGKDGMTRLYDKNGVELTEIAQTDIDNPASVGKYYWHTDKTLWLIVAKGAYADISAARTALGTMTLIYQLAQEQVIPVQVSGTLVGFPSGTVYWEQIVPDAGVYTDKMEVLHKDLPIKSIEKLSKVDFTTGVEYELDPFQAVVSANRLSFTHPELQEGDIVFFIYEYDRESTIPEVEVEFYDSRYVVKDSATGKFYKWSITVTNGTPSIQLTEV